MSPKTMKSFRRGRSRAEVFDQEGARVDSVGRLMSYAPPWAIWAALPIPAEGFHLLTEPSPAAGTAVGAALGAAGIGMSLLTAHLFTPRGGSVRAHATTSVAAAGGWLVWSAASGLFHHPVWHTFHPLDYVGSCFNGWPVGAWAVLGPIAAVTWNLRRAARGQGNDTHANGSDLLAKVGIAGQIKRPVLEAGDTRVRATVEVVPGEQTAADVQQAKGRLASLLGVRESAVRVTRDPNNFAKAEMTVVPRDQLSHTIPWKGPSAPGQSIAVEIPVGRYEDAETARLWLPGDPKKARNASHYGVMGQSGAGKSEGVLILLTEAITRSDCSIVYSDPVKGIQTVAPIAAGVDLLSTEQKTAVAAYRALQKVIRARTARLGQYGFKQWVPAAATGPCQLKYLIYVWEEAAALLANSSQFAAITEQARSAGITLVPSQQRMSHDRMDTSARYNLGGGWCFGIGDELSAKFALSDQTLDAGAAPWEWRDRKPGYSYLEAPGVPEDRWSMPLRTFFGEEGHMRDVVAEFAPGRGLDPTTAAAFGAVYTDYRALVDSGDAAWQTRADRTTRIPVSAPTQPRHAAPAGNTEPDDIDDDESTGLDPDAGDSFDVDPEFEIPAQPEPGFMDTIDASKPITADENDDPPMSFGSDDAHPRAAAMTPTQAREALRTSLIAFARAGHDTVQPGHLVDFRRKIGRSASWLTIELQKLTAEGFIAVHPDRGHYGLPNPDGSPATAPDADAHTDADDLALV